MPSKIKCKKSFLQLRDKDNWEKWNLWKSDRKDCSVSETHFSWFRPFFPLVSCCDRLKKAFVWLTFLSYCNYLLKYLWKTVCRYQIYHSWWNEKLKSREKQYCHTILFSAVQSACKLCHCEAKAHFFHLLLLFSKNKNKHPNVLTGRKSKERDSTNCHRRRTGQKSFVKVCLQAPGVSVMMAWKAEIQLTMQCWLNVLPVVHLHFALCHDRFFSLGFYKKTLDFESFFPFFAYLEFV